MTTSRAEEAEKRLQIKHGYWLIIDGEKGHFTVCAKGTKGACVYRGTGNDFIMIRFEDLGKHWDFWED